MARHPPPTESILVACVIAASPEPLGGNLFDTLTISCALGYLQPLDNRHNASRHRKFAFTSVRMQRATEDARFDRK